MITQFIFDIDTCEQISRTCFPPNGPVTFNNRALVPKTRECVAITVKEGYDAEQEMMTHFGDDSSWPAGWWDRLTQPRFLQLKVSGRSSVPFTFN